MSSRPPDATLRRLVADLALVHRDDRAAILGALAPPERSRVEALLAGYRGEPVARENEPAAPAGPPTAWRIEGASSWLLALLDGESPAAARKSGGAPLTPAGREALAAAAAPFRCADPLAKAPRGPTLLDWIRRLAGGAR